MTVAVTNVSMSSTELDKLAALVALILKNGGETIKIDQTATPTAISDVGQVYTKSDNKLYFQDGDGEEHEVFYKEDTIPLVEVTEAPADVDSVGRLFTKADNLLYFQDGAGATKTVTIT